MLAVRGGSMIKKLLEVIWAVLIEHKTISALDAAYEVE